MTAAFVSIGLICVALAFLLIVIGGIAGATTKHENELIELRKQAYDLQQRIARLEANEIKLYSEAP